jgi:hypothetical protein
MLGNITVRVDDMMNRAGPLTKEKDYLMGQIEEEASVDQEALEQAPKGHFEVVNPPSIDSNAVFFNRKYVKAMLMGDVGYSTSYIKRFPV